MGFRSICQTREEWGHVRLLGSRSTAVGPRSPCLSPPLSKLSRANHPSALENASPSNSEHQTGPRALPTRPRGHPSQPVLRRQGAGNEARQRSGDPEGGRAPLPALQPRRPPALLPQPGPCERKCFPGKFWPRLPPGWASETRLRKREGSGRCPPAAPGGSWHRREARRPQSPRPPPRLPGGRSPPPVSIQSQRKAGRPQAPSHAAIFDCLSSVGLFSYGF